MATTIQELAGFMANRELKYELKEAENQIVTGFGTEHYKDPLGHKGVLVLVELVENGEFVIFTAPMLYSYHEGPHKEALLQMCLWISYRTKLLQFEYDPNDGEVRAVIEIPLEDAPMTELQMMRCIMSLVSIIDEHDPEIRAAMEGKQPAADSAADHNFMAAFSRFMEEQEGSQGAAPAAEPGKKKATRRKKSGPAKKPTDD